MVINRKQIEARQVRALTIVGQQDQIKRINAVTYKVKSQSSDFWYDVIHEYKQGWTCSCPDYILRLSKYNKDQRYDDIEQRLQCKHILSVLISKELRNKIVNSSDVKEIEKPVELTCKCGSINIIKDGVRKNKSGTIQRFKCKECQREWSDNLGFAGNKVNSKIITVALDLYFKGVSLRKVKEHIKFFYGISVSHVAILGWIQKFSEVVTPFVDSLVPKEMSGVYHVDEMAVHVRKEQTDKGHYQWLWNMMDNTLDFGLLQRYLKDEKLKMLEQYFKMLNPRHLHLWQ